MREVLPARWIMPYTCTILCTSNDSNLKASMRIVTYSEARSSLKSVLDAVHDDADVTVISRRDGADAVVMSFDYYQSIMETMHLLSTPANAAHLAKSIAQHKAGKATRRELAKA
jgi:antitoxin YefM